MKGKDAWHSLPLDGCMDGEGSGKFLRALKEHSSHEGGIRGIHFLGPFLYVHYSHLSKEGSWRGAVLCTFAYDLSTAVGMNKDTEFCFHSPVLA